MCPDKPERLKRPDRLNRPEKPDKPERPDRPNNRGNPNIQSLTQEAFPTHRDLKWARKVGEVSNVPLSP